MDQAFARSGLRHVECLHLCRDLARVIVDASLVLLWYINHCDWYSGYLKLCLVITCVIDLWGWCTVSTYGIGMA